jgi:hypothetical protein
MTTSKTKSVAHIVVILLLISLTALVFNAPASTCTGSDPCHACKNCRYCKHCAKEGGICGVCKSRA